MNYREIVRIMDLLKEKFLDFESILDDCDDQQELFNNLAVIFIRTFNDEYSEAVNVFAFKEVIEEEYSIDVQDVEDLISELNTIKRLLDDNESENSSKNTHVQNHYESTGESGYVYVLMNPSMEGIVKIGMTTRDPETRMNELSNATGVPIAFILVYKEFTVDCTTAEKRIHITLEKHRLSAKREFFRLPVHEAIKCVQEICAQVGIADSFNVDEDVYSKNNNNLAAELIDQAKKFYYGLGDELEDEDEALSLFKKAAQLGSVEAYCYLGKMYINGSGCKADMRIALDYYKKGASLGDRACFAEMAKVYSTDGNYKNVRNMERCWEMFFNGLEDERLNDSDIWYLRQYIDNTAQYDIEMAEEYRKLIVSYKDRIIKHIEDSIEHAKDKYPNVVDIYARDILYIERMFNSDENIDLNYNAFIKELQVFKGIVILRSKIKTGQIHTGDKVRVFNENGSYIARIERIDRKGRNVEQANVDDYVGLIVVGKPEEFIFVKEYCNVVEDSEVKGFIELLEI